MYLVAELFRYLLGRQAEDSVAFAFEAGRTRSIPQVPSLPDILDIHTCILICICIQMYMYMCIYIYIYIHMYMYTCFGVERPLPKAVGSFQESRAPR